MNLRQPTCEALSEAWLSPLAAPFGVQQPEFNVKHHDRYTPYPAGTHGGGNTKDRCFTEPKVVHNPLTLSPCLDPPVEPMLSE